MADYHAPTVLTPNIPEHAMTPFERLILGLVFDGKPCGDGEVYFHSWCVPSKVVTVAVDDLRVALEKSREQGQTSVNKHVATLLARYDAQADEDAPDDIDVDVTGINAGCDRIFQNILQRSPKIDEIIVVAAWTCARMRSDGFGGSIVRVTETLSSIPRRMPCSRRCATQRCCPTMMQAATKRDDVLKRSPIRQGGTVSPCCC